ncbi:protein sidekick-2 isoform X1 [Tachysurus ichikawai]
MSRRVPVEDKTGVLFVWEKDGQLINPQSSPRLRLDINGTLHISQTWSGDIGSYTCRVTSQGGNDSHTAHLKVRQLPHAPENPTAILSSVEKRTINLTWAKPFDGNSPLIRYILEVSENNAPWTVLIADVAPSSTALTVSELTPARSYQFRLCAENNVGRGSFSTETRR